MRMIIVFSLLNFVLGYHLSHENKHHKEERSYKCCNAAVLKAFLDKTVFCKNFQILYWATHLWVITLLTQSVLHNAVPIVSCGDSEQSEVGHSEWSEVGVLPQAMARVVFITFLGLLLILWKLWKCFSYQVFQRAQHQARQRWRREGRTEDRGFPPEAGLASLCPIGSGYPWPFSKVSAHEQS